MTARISDPFVKSCSIQPRRQYGDIPILLPSKQTREGQILNGAADTPDVFFLSANPHKMEESHFYLIYRVPPRGTLPDMNKLD